MCLFVVKSSGIYSFVPDLFLFPECLYSGELLGVDRQILVYLVFDVLWIELFISNGNHMSHWMAIFHIILDTYFLIFHKRTNICFLMLANNCMCTQSSQVSFEYLKLMMSSGPDLNEASLRQKMWKVPNSSIMMTRCIYYTFFGSMLHHDLGLEKGGAHW